MDIELDPFKINPIGKLRDGLVVLKKIAFEQSNDLAFINLCFVKGETIEPSQDYVTFTRLAERIEPTLYNVLQSPLDLSGFKSYYLAQNPLAGIAGDGINSAEGLVTLYLDFS